MDEQVERRRPWLAVFNTLLTIVGFVLAGWCVVTVSYAAFGGMRAPAYVIIYLLLWMAFNRSFAVAQHVVAPGRARLALRIAKWILPFVLPLFVIRAVEANVQARQLEIVTRDLAPVIAYADAQSSETFIAADAPAPPFATPVHYQDTGASYTLWLHAPAIDLDGYTLRYDSKARHWQRRHNDRAEAAHAVDGRCILKVSKWTCYDATSPTSSPSLD